VYGWRRKGIKGHTAVVVGCTWRRADTRGRAAREKSTQRGKKVRMKKARLGGEERGWGDGRAPRHPATHNHTALGQGAQRMRRHRQQGT